MNVDIENTMKQCATSPDYQQIQPHEKTIPYVIPCKPWEVVGADTFSINNNMPLCIVDYNTKFPIIKKADGLSAEDLFSAAKIVFAEFGLPKKIISDTVINFVSDGIKQLCKQLNIDQAIISSYHHQSNGQVEECIKIVNCFIRKCFDNNNGTDLALLQVRSVPISTGLISSATLLFNRQIGALLPKMKREPINIYGNNEYYNALKHVKIIM